jgi:hypothetical protein
VQPGSEEPGRRSPPIKSASSDGPFTEPPTRVRRLLWTPSAVSVKSFRRNLKFILRSTRHRRTPEGSLMASLSEENGQAQSTGAYTLPPAPKVQRSRAGRIPATSNPARRQAPKVLS